MGIFRKFIERRAESEIVIDDPVLRALLGSSGVTKTTAMQIPTVASALNLIANTVASTPIMLYSDEGGRAVELSDDYRLRLLNEETGDTLNANEFLKALVIDYFLGKGGYAYIHKEKGAIKSLHYVDESYITIQKNTDPIFKSFDILVNGQRYYPHDFIKILRNTKDGASGTSIVEDHSQILEVAFETMVFERNLVKKGGNKKGFLKSPRKLTGEAIAELKRSYRELYSNNSDNVVVLNDGMTFEESSNTSVEMQLQENKTTNANEICKLFSLATKIVGGGATDAEISSFAKLAVLPLLKTFECALNRDLLLESEKAHKYFAFDTKELLKGGMKERFEAYALAIDKNIMQIDEVRYIENLPELGLAWIKLGLDSVLYDVNTGKFYTPNTNQLATMDSQHAGGLPATEKGDETS